MKSYKLTINGEKYDARILEYSGSHAKVSVNGTEFYIQIDQDKGSVVPILASQEKSVPLAPSFSSGVDAGSGEIKAPIPGVISSISVKEGDTVKKGQTLLILEAMKMESEIAAPVDGKITKIIIKERSPVQEGDLLMVMESKELQEKPVQRPRPQAAPTPIPVADNILRAPIPGLIIDVMVREGQRVDENTAAFVLEAMKMESEIHSNGSGSIKKIHVKKGDMVQEGDPLLELEA